MVGLGGLEPPTSPLSGARSSHLSYRPIAKQLGNFSMKIAAVANLGSDKFSDFSFHLVLLHKSHWRDGVGAFRRFLNWAELRLVARNIFAERAPDTFRVARAYDNAAKQFALRSVGENVDEIQSEFLDVVMNHHQVAVKALQFFFVGFNLHLPRLWLLLFFVHALLLNSAFQSTTRAQQYAQRPRNVIEQSLSMRESDGSRKCWRLPDPVTLWRSGTWTPATGPRTSAAAQNSATRC